MSKTLAPKRKVKSADDIRHEDVIAQIEVSRTSFYKAHAALQTKLTDAEDRIYKLVAECHRDLRDLIESRLPAPEVVEGQKWAPKKDDWIMPKVSHAANGKALEARIYKVTVTDDPMDTDLSVCLGEHRWIKLDDCRPATDAEVQAHLEEQERIKKEEEVTELQDGDACEVTGEEGALVYDMAKRLLDIKDNGGRAIRYQTQPALHGPDKGELIGTDREHWLGTKLNWLPFPEFKRRLEGTIARKKLEREEEERNKPLTFGQPIEHTHRGKGIYMGMDGILYELAFIHHGYNRQHNWMTITCPRDQFTVSPDQRPANT